MDKLRDFLGIRRMDGVGNSRIRELCGVMRGLSERIDKSVPRWFRYVEKMENHKIASRVYIGE